MKRLILIPALAAALCGCCIEDEYGEERAVTVVTASRTVETKVTVAQSSVVGDTVDVFAYDDDELRRLDTYERTVLGRNGLKVASRSGKKIVAIIVNNPAGRYVWSARNTYAYYERLEADLCHERSASPTMSGTCQLRGGSGKDCSITLKPVMSKVILRSIRCDFTGKTYEGAELTDAKVYLTNVSSLCKVSQESNFRTRETINTRRLDEKDLSRMEEPGMVRQSLPDRIGKDWQEVSRTLYCYPNNNEEDSFSSPYTRLVVEGKINGTTWYYPININREDICWVEDTPGISRDRCYVYDITIKRTGSTDPDTPISIKEVSVICNVIPWTEKEARDELF